MIEQAAHDRNLFQSSPGSKHVDLKFPEYVYAFCVIYFAQSHATRRDLFTGKRLDQDDRY